MHIKWDPGRAVAIMKVIAVLEGMTLTVAPMGLIHIEALAGTRGIVSLAGTTRNMAAADTVDIATPAGMTGSATLVGLASTISLAPAATALTVLMGVVHLLTGIRRCTRQGPRVPMDSRECRH